MRKAVVHPIIVGVVAGCLGAGSVLPPEAHALPTESFPPARSSILRDSQMAQIMSVLERPAAQWHLRVAGLTPDDARQALAALDDAQLAEVARHAEQVRAAGEALLVVGISLGAILLVALVAIIIYLIVKND